MKKTYQKPELSVFATGFQLLDTMAISGGTTGGNITGGDAKDRAYDEDNEAFNVTGGSGSASYGDLW